MKNQVLGRHRTNCQDRQLFDFRMGSTVRTRTRELPALWQGGHADDHAWDWSMLVPVGLVIRFQESSLLRNWLINMKGPVRVLATFVLTLVSLVSAQTGTSSDQPSRLGKGMDYLINYLNMAGTNTAAEFRPLSQNERTQLYLKSMANPLGFAKAGFSAGIDQWKDKPAEWEQGASGYGKRFVNIFGQYSIQRTVTFCLSSALHEDNRYFNSGKEGMWSRTGYALSSGILARADDGSRHLSISQLGGVAAGAFLSRSWQPSSQSSAGNGAVSFGITMASNMGVSVLKEFIPDLGRMITKKQKKN